MIYEIRDNNYQFYNEGLPTGQYARGLFIEEIDDYYILKLLNNGKRVKVESIKCILVNEEETCMKNRSESNMISFDKFGNDSATLVVATYEGSITRIVNVITGKEAEDLYKQLTKRDGTVTLKCCSPEYARCTYEKYKSLIGTIHRYNGEDKIINNVKLQGIEVVLELV